MPAEEGAEEAEEEEEEEEEEQEEYEEYWGGIRKVRGTRTTSRRRESEGEEE